MILYFIFVQNDIKLFDVIIALIFFMKKCLILAYDFPPYVSVGGIRPYTWYRYFKEFDVYPIIVTRQWSNKHGNFKDYISAGESVKTQIEVTEFGTLVKAPYHPNLSNRLLLKYGEYRFRIIRKILTAYAEFGQFLFMSGTKSTLYFAAKDFLKSNNVDIIIATGVPFILFKYASLLSKIHNVPWIADYRDPWTQDKNNRKNIIIQKWDAYFEKRYISSASSIVTISVFLKILISSLIKGKTFHIIPNGYDPEAIDATKGIEQGNEILNYSLVGTIYKWHPIKSFLRVGSEFVKKNPETEFRINFFGVNAENEIREMLHSTFENLLPKVKIYPRMPNLQLLQKLAYQNVFILFDQHSYMGTKIYDFIALNRKIILCYNDDDEANELKRRYFNIDESDSESRHLQADLINETNSGIVVKDAAHLSNVLADLSDEFSTHGYISCNSINTQQFSRKIQIKKLAGIILNYFSEKEKKYQQCSRCVMDTSDPNITFDDRGFCNHCNEYLEKTSKRSYQGKKSDIELAKLVEKIKRSGKHKDYDCVIGVSGGVDSIYTAYLAKQLGLRPLAVHMDNGWNSELAVSNIEKILNKLEIDLYTFVLDWETFRDLQLAFLKASVVEAETPTDIAIPAALHKVAEKYGIKYIFSGGNYATEGILPKYWHYNAKDVKYLKAINKQFGKRSLKSFPSFGFEREIYYKLLKGIKMIYLLNYIPYNKQEAVSLLERKLDWRNYGGKHHESVYTKFIQSYLLTEKFGIDYRRATFSTQICSGQITRSEALAGLSKKIYDPLTMEEEKAYISKKLNIDITELEQIIKLPPRSFRDYPNDEKRLEFIYTVYRKLNK